VNSNRTVDSFLRNQGLEHRSIAGADSYYGVTPAGFWAGIRRVTGYRRKSYFDSLELAEF